MDRRAGGIAALVFALVAVLAGPRLVSPGLAGHASALPLPEPPPIAGCVDLADRTATVVDCAVAHDGEVFARWSADDPARPRGRNSTACADLLTGFLGVDPLQQIAGWDAVVPAVATLLIRAPAAERVGRRGWAACVLLPADPAAFVGSLSTAVTTGRWPGAFAECAAADGSTIVPCTAPHQVERLGTVSGIRPLPDDTELDPTGLPADFTAQLQAQCYRLAQAITRNPDPTYGAQLTVDVDGAGTNPAWGGSLSGYLAFSATCRLTSDQLLTDSVAGLGDASLPTA